MAGAASGAGDSLVDWTGVCLQRIQDSAVAADRSDEASGWRLEADADRVDFFVCDRDAGIIGGSVWAVAGDGWAAEGDVCVGGLFRCGSLHFAFRRDSAPSWAGLFW